MNHAPALTRAQRCVAAVLAGGVTGVVFSVVVSLGADDHDRLVVAITLREQAAALAQRAVDVPAAELLASAPAY